jgi:hypothetical protein
MSLFCVTIVLRKVTHSMYVPMKNEKAKWNYRNTNFSRTEKCG